MNNLKVAVYAICKNEEKFVDRWYNSIKDADGIFVLDTGSTDKTLELLKKYPINVFEEQIKPWRFDVARNKSLELVPDNFDICLCIDLDEVMHGGWKEEILKSWNSDTTRLHYIYNWYIDKYNKPQITFYLDKIHKRHGYKWVNPVHEVLICDSEEKNVYNHNIILDHFPDYTKSRKSYLPLLELSIREDPYNDRNMHYLGREYMYYKRWQECIDTLIKHLNLNSTWKDERAASMRFIARSYINLNRYDEAKMWLDKAIKEAPYLREAYAEKAMLYYSLKDYRNATKYGLKSLKIKNKPLTYINELFAYNETIPLIISNSYYYLNDINKAIYYVRKALKINPNNEDLHYNLNFFKEIKKLQD